MNIRNILALEGEWDDSIKDTKSVAPALQFLQQVRLIDFVHRRVPFFTQGLDDSRGAIGRELATFGGEIVKGWAT